MITIYQAIVKKVLIADYYVIDMNVTLFRSMVGKPFAALLGATLERRIQ